MKIVHVITAFGLGGAEKLLLNTLNEQVEDHRVHLVYLKEINDLLPELDDRVEVKNIRLSVWVIKNLRKYYEMVEPDIIHTHLGHADILGIWAARNMNSKLFCTIHSTSFRKNTMDRVFFMIYKLLLKRVRTKINIISISKAVQAVVTKKIQIPSERSHLLYNAIPAAERLRSKREIKKELSLSENKMTLLFVGRLTKAKSVETFLKSIKLLSVKGYSNKFEVLIVGDGRQKEVLKSLATELEINNIVRFEGEVLNVDEYFNAADLFILPSIWEGFGIVILEAFRAKAAVISSDIDGPSEIIGHNQNGMLFSPSDHQDLSEKIIELLKDKNKRERLAQKGFETFTGKYLLENYVESLNQLYKNAP